jgi:hypothetical protein
LDTANGGDGGRVPRWSAERYRASTDLVHVAPACERLGDDRELAPAQIEFGVRILETTGRPVPMGTEGLWPATG